jgi:hypothetical protein
MQPDFAVDLLLALKRLFRKRTLQTCQLDFTSLRGTHTKYANNSLQKTLSCITKVVVKYNSSSVCIEGDCHNENSGK